MTSKITTTKTWLLGCIVVAFVFFMSTRAVAQTPAPAQKSSAAATGNSENGKKLFESYGCYECHGHHAEGSSVGGPRLGPNPISLAAMIRYVRQPAGQMPPFTAKVVSDAELADIHAYLQSLPQPPKLDSIPALK